jgi:hypothetical protein
MKTHVCGQKVKILGTFAKLLKTIIDFVVCFRQSVWNNSATTRRIFMTCYICVIFLKSLEEIQVPLKSDKNIGYFT